MRRGIVALVMMTIAIILMSCQHNQLSTSPRSSKTEHRIPAPLLGETGLRPLLLSADQIDTIMHAKGMTSHVPRTGLPDDSASMEPQECLAIDGSAQKKVYAGSGYIAVRQQSFTDGDNFKHYADQAVILFPTVGQATAFFDSQDKQWPQCHHYRHVQSRTEWEPGEITNTDGILRTVTVQLNSSAKGWACGRALAARNNVVVDVNTCSADPEDSALEIASAIAQKIPVWQNPDDLFSTSSHR